MVRLSSRSAVSNPVHSWADTQRDWMVIPAQAHMDTLPKEHSMATQTRRTTQRSARFFRATIKAHVVVACCGLVLLSAVAAYAELPLNGLPLNGVPLNGMPRNGMPFHGLILNGTPMNGIPWNGIGPNGIPFNGVPIQGMPYNGMPFQGLLLNGTPYNGYPIQGMPIQGMPMNGTPLQLSLIHISEPTRLLSISYA